MHDGRVRGTFGGGAQPTVGDPRQPPRHTSRVRCPGITSRLLPASFPSRAFMGKREVEERRSSPATPPGSALFWAVLAGPEPALSLA